MPSYLPYEEFIKSFEYCPRVAVELVIQDSEGNILYVKRETEPFLDQHHFPGGFLLKGERINEAIERIALKELDFGLSSKDTTLTRMVENLNGDPRGHIIHLVFEKKISETEKNYLKNATFLPIPPEDCIPFELLYIESLPQEGVWDVS